MPESFADLLTLCKNLKEVDIDTDEDYMSISVPKADLIYFEDEILMVAGFQKLEIKPAQMWQIIKNLIKNILKMVQIYIIQMDLL